MSGYPNNVRTEPSSAPILSGLPVSAVQTWQPAGAAVQWLNGTGSHLIPAASIVLSKAVTTTNQTFHFKVYTRAQAIERIWAVQLVGVLGVATQATINANSYGDMTVDVPAVGVVNTPFIYREILSSQSAAATAMSIKISSVGGKSVQVVSISCWEQWRPKLAESSTDLGINEQSIRPRERIYLGNSPTVNDSVTGIYDSLAACDARRAGLFHWAVDDANPSARSGAYQSILGLTMPILTRKLNSGQTTGTVYWSAFCKVNAGNGDVQITATNSAVTDSVNVTGTSFAWTTARAISVDCEDLSVADGRQGSAWDEVDVQIRGNGGNTLSIAAFSIWEAP